MSPIARRAPADRVARLRGPADQQVTFVELFFDLVFVFAITQVTKVVVEDLTWAGAGEALLVFWMIFVLLAGIIAVAAGTEEMVLHPEEPLPTVVRLTLALGIVLYLGGTDLAWWRATGRILIARTTVGLLLALSIVLIETAALGEIGLVVGGLGLVVLLEQFSRPRSGLALEADPVGPATTT